MLWGEVLLQLDPFGTYRQMEPSIQSLRTSYHLRKSSRPRPRIPVVSIRQGSSASAKTSPCGIAPFWRLCPSPSRVCHLLSPCLALNLCHLPHLPHPPHHRNLNDRSDCPDCIQHLFKCHFWLSGGQSHLFNIAHFFLLLLAYCLCVFNSLSCHRSLSLHIILNPLLCLFITQEVRFSWFLRCKLHFESQVTQCSKCSDPFCLQPGHPFLRLITLSCGLLCWFAIFTCQDMGKVLCQSINHCISCRLLLGEMLDVAKYGPYGGKLGLLCQGW